MSNSIQTIIILYASQSGTSEYLSNQLYENLKSKLSSLTIKCDSIENFEQYLSQSYLQHPTLYLFVISTSLEGSPPSSMSDFSDYTSTQKAISVFTSPNFEYSIFGNGNSNYEDTYQQASRQFKELLKSKFNRNPLIECREGDQSEGNAEVECEEWETDIINYFKSLE
ncbi:hypothetical protein C9374_013660 [Naegleria lovaniensis]|uniref:Flavodoxin-like domain-containing protein n=1 Tax=Naegleria lovaniensis TaxID=51637 RepID=A0AA88KHA5_NAELO|nr:uncharacterized protein C9374_013660 [Naegleria lovaniensis]KAG2372652.1 hypothetical protein C9374_013660 [Naegleria lovaniensis]